jgi:hypothetical protein
MNSEFMAGFFNLPMVIMAFGLGVGVGYYIAKKLGWTGLLPYIGFFAFVPTFIATAMSIICWYGRAVPWWHAAISCAVFVVMWLLLKKGGWSLGETLCPSATTANRPANRDGWHGET